MASVLALCLLAGACPSAMALYIDGYTPAHNDRFVGGDISQPNATFLGVPYDLSGIAVDAGAVMISPHYFVTAAHTGSPGSLTFVNTLGQPVTKTVASSTVLLTGDVVSDLRIGQLADDSGLTAADHVSYYPLIVQPEQWYVGQQLFVYGQNNQAGLNTIGFIDDGDFGNGASLTRLVGYFYDSANPYPDQTRLVGGDSGKPLGMIWDGQYIPLGAHFGVATASSTVTVSASSFIPYYLDQINAYMASSNEQVTILSVPEPAVAGVVTTIALLLLGARRRTA